MTRVYLASKKNNGARDDKHGCHATDLSFAEWWTDGHGESSRDTRRGVTAMRHYLVTVLDTLLLLLLLLQGTLMTRLRLKLSYNFRI